MNEPSSSSSGFSSLFLYSNITVSLTTSESQLTCIETIPASWAAKCIKSFVGVWKLNCTLIRFNLDKCNAKRPPGQRLLSQAVHQLEPDNFDPIPMGLSLRLLFHPTINLLQRWRTTTASWLWNRECLWGWKALLKSNLEKSNREEEKNQSSKMIELLVIFGAVLFFVIKRLSWAFLAYQEFVTFMHK